MAGLFVGKASSLRHRVRLFSPRHAEPGRSKIRGLVKSIADLISSSCAARRTPSLPKAADQGLPAALQHLFKDDKRFRSCASNGASFPAYSAVPLSAQRRRNLFRALHLISRGARALEFVENIMVA